MSAKQTPEAAHPGHVLGWRVERRVCVSRGPAFGIAFALPWSLVMWAASGIVAAMVIG